MSEMLIRSREIENQIKQMVCQMTEKPPTYDGYPVTRFSQDTGIVLDTTLTIPDGPWDAGPENLTLPNLDLQRQLQLEGYQLDSLGRPLHPWLLDMIENPLVGVATGRGSYWSWGPNRTADPIVITTEENPHTLLIRRNDNGQWALAGGFLDPGEDPVEAGRRELYEESGLEVSGPADAVVYSGVVGDMRTTAHAWAETTAMVWYVKQQTRLNPDVKEVSAARWVDIRELSDYLHGSHAFLVAEAIHHGTTQN